MNANRDPFPIGDLFLCFLRLFAAIFLCFPPCLRASSAASGESASGDSDAFGGDVGGDDAAWPAGAEASDPGGSGVYIIAVELDVVAVFRHDVKRVSVGQERVGGHLYAFGMTVHKAELVLTAMADVTAGL